jgi:uncharacterized membrane protein (DUF373 family)
MKDAKQLLVFILDIIFICVLWNLIGDQINLALYKIQTDNLLFMQKINGIEIILSFIFLFLINKDTWNA